MSDQRACSRRARAAPRSRRAPPRRRRRSARRARAARGSGSSAFAIASFCFMPPESAPAARSANGASPVRSSSAARAPSNSSAGKRWRRRREAEVLDHREIAMQAEDLRHVADPRLQRRDVAAQVVAEHARRRRPRPRAARRASAAASSCRRRRDRRRRRSRASSSRSIAGESAASRRSASRGRAAEQRRAHRDPCRRRGEVDVALGAGLEALDVLEDADLGAIDLADAVAPRLDLLGREVRLVGDEAHLARDAAARPLSSSISTRWPTRKRSTSATGT